MYPVRGVGRFDLVWPVLGPILAPTFSIKWSPVPRSILFLFIAVLALAACGGGASTPLPTPTLSPQQFQGKQVFETTCAACHSLAPDTLIVGPSLAGIAAVAGTRLPGQDARSYLMNSIMRPGDYLVEGFQDLMPKDLGKSLSGEEIDAVIAYLLSQP